MTAMRTVGAAMLATICAAAVVAADDAGRLTFMQHCATCHGAAGLGDGPMAGSLVQAPSDLTQLAARNDGAFPMLKVLRVIDGRSEVAAHGGPMPVWGAVFSAQSADAGPRSADHAARGKILSVAYFLESIQK